MVYYGASKKMDYYVTAKNYMARNIMKTCSWLTMQATELYYTTGAQQYETINQLETGRRI